MDFSFVMMNLFIFISLQMFSVVVGKSKKPETHLFYNDFNSRYTSRSKNLRGQAIDVQANSSVSSESFVSTSFEDTDIEDKISHLNFPFVATIQHKGVHYSTGALIHEKWVLTTAALFYNFRESMKFLRIRLGSKNSKKGGFVTAVKRIDIHPSYVYGQPNFDLALLQLAELAPLSTKIQLAKLATSKTELFNSKFISVYWPRIIIDKTPLPMNAEERKKHNRLRLVEQELQPSNECLDYMESINKTLHNSSLCLYPTFVFHSTCIPDAGALVLQKENLWGITSVWTSSRHCKKYRSPTIFTRVAPMVIKSWLDTVLDTHKNA